MAPCKVWPMQMMQQGLLHRHVRGNEGQCAIGGLLRGDWEACGHSHCSLVWRTRAFWCCREPLALESVTQSALISVFLLSFMSGGKMSPTRMHDKRKVSLKKPCHACGLMASLPCASHSHSEQEFSGLHKQHSLTFMAATLLNCPPSRQIIFKAGQRDHYVL